MPSRCARRPLRRERRGIDAEVRVGVGEPAGVVNRRSICARSAASGRRPSAGSRASTSSSGTSSQTETPSRLMAARLSGSTNVPPPVATTTWRSGSSRCRISRSTARKYGSPLPREDVGDRPALARLDQLVDVLGAPAEPPGQRPRHGRLAGGHEADEDRSCRPSPRVSRSSVVEEAGIRDVDRRTRR